MTANQPWQAGSRPDRWASLTVPSATGVPIRVRLLRAGETYGATGALTATADFVEFYDARYRHTDHGQFISRYHADSILGRDGWGSRSGGLVLNTSQPDWELDDTQMAGVRTWVADRLALSYVETTEAPAAEDRLQAAQRHTHGANPSSTRATPQHGR